MDYEATHLVELYLRMYFSQCTHYVQWRQKKKSHCQYFQKLVNYAKLKVTDQNNLYTIRFGVDSSIIFYAYI